MQNADTYSAPNITSAVRCAIAHSEGVLLFLGVADPANLPPLHHIIFCHIALALHNVQVLHVLSRGSALTNLFQSSARHIPLPRIKESIPSKSLEFLINPSDS